MGQDNSQFVSDAFQKIISGFINGIDEGMKLGARLFWNILISFLREHWFVVMVGLLVLLVIATFKAMAGRWGSLGSLIYNLLYFGTLFLIGLIKGPEVFVNNFFNAACALILYPICYLITGLVLRRLGFLRFR